MKPIALGVNIDHVATVRQARGGAHPDPVRAALMAEEAGADSITLHLREDRRHIQDQDVATLRPLLKTHMNLEMAVTEEMIGIALKAQPSDVCFVPERRAEVTTEGGLDAHGQAARIAQAVARMTAAGIRASLFIDPDLRQVEAAAAVRAPVIELHTGAYAHAQGDAQQQELARLVACARRAVELGLQVNAGHGLNYQNVRCVAAIPEILELNIGHALIGHAVFVGLTAAVREMKALMQAART